MADGPTQLRAALEVLRTSYVERLRANIPRPAS